MRTSLAHTLGMYLTIIIKHREMHNLDYASPLFMRTVLPWKEDFSQICGTEKIFHIVDVQNYPIPIPTAHVINAMVRLCHELLNVDTGKMQHWH